MSSISLPALLEVLSGAMSIVTGVFALHLIAHILTTHSPREFLRKRPLGLEIAVALLITTLGWFGRSVVIWEWRARSVNDDVNAAIAQSHLPLNWLVVGTFMAMVGYICLIRVFTRVTYGNWPWVSTLIIVAVYVGFNLR